MIWICRDLIVGNFYFFFFFDNIDFLLLNFHNYMELGWSSACTEASLEQLENASLDNHVSQQSIIGGPCWDPAMQKNIAFHSVRSTDF